MQADLGKNYFELFGLPAQFDIDPTDLASRYRELQRRFHPDRFAAASAAERRLSVQMTAQINAAYQALRDVVSRGRYLLHLRGVRTDEETDTRMNPEFLMEQMALREALEDSRHAAGRDADALRGRVDAMIEARTRALRGYFEDGSDSAHQAARASVRELQFLRKLATEIDELD